MTSKHLPRRGFLSKIGKLIRTILIALVVAFLVGFTLGTLLRGEVDKPVRYIGARDRGDHDCHVYRVYRVYRNSATLCTFGMHACVMSLS